MFEEINAVELHTLELQVLWNQLTDGRLSWKSYLDKADDAEDQINNLLSLPLQGLVFAHDKEE